MSSEWLTTREAAEHLRVDPKTLYRWRESARLPHYVRGGVIRYRAEELDEWMSEGRRVDVPGRSRARRSR